ncbi:hypothetical protein A1353_23190 [Methylomonas methanica]|uniref:Trypsin-like peptidase n=1 Tax=Methylomonas methanica TaxID=421 RepID=A0A177LWB8_METMH|nr:hypothetical protein [Methylomonas methanica]OAH97334.1 hypothetical protein A1353_23190 [Methylomonas methanica]
MEPTPDLKRLRYCARPMVFETGVPETPLSVAGTAFIVAFRNNLLVLTAKHVVGEWPTNKLRLIVSEAGDCVTFTDRWNIRVEDEEENGDQNDLVIFQADIANVSVAAREENHVINLTPPDNSDWYGTRNNALFFLFGYPKLATGVDYELSKVISSQYLLHGAYIGDSLSFGCYKLAVQNPLKLTSFDGLSGSPVFSLFTGSANAAQPTFCGIAIRGTASSGKVHIGYFCPSPRKGKN